MEVFFCDFKKCNCLRLLEVLYLATELYLPMGTLGNCLVAALGPRARAPKSRAAGSQQGARARTQGREIEVRYLSTEF